MKKYILKAVALCFTATVLFLQQGCVKDKCNHKYTTYVYTPVYKSMSDLRQVSIQSPKSITTNGKVFVKNNFIYLNEVNKGFHVIDNTNPSAPKNIAFVNVPGCIDIAAAGNYLLADNYVDLVTFDISNPVNIQLVNRKENALPYRRYNYGFSDDSAKGIIVRFDKSELPQESGCEETRNWWIRGGAFFTVIQSTIPNAVPVKNLGGANGQAGSLSRFALLNNYLYIANRFSLTAIDVSNPLQPIVKPATFGTGEIETIYPFKNVLLLGSPTGMSIFSVTNPAVPVYAGGISHWRGCDPVVAENNTAYVTVRGGGPCGGSVSQLDIIDISNIYKPVLQKSYPLQNPYGLGIYNNTLGICDGNEGFKLYTVNNTNLQMLSSLNTINAFDVIMNNDIALLIAKDGMYQYDISNKQSLVLLSKLSITN
jgi:hypothetical protein